MKRLMSGFNPLELSFWLSVSRVFVGSMVYVSMTLVDGCVWILSGRWSLYGHYFLILVSSRCSLWL